MERRDEEIESGDTEAPAETPMAAADLPQRIIIVSKKKRKKYSKELKGIQVDLKGGVKALHYITDGVADGVKEYIRQSKKSSQAKQDGALKDILKNITKSFSVAVRKVSLAPYELAKTIDTDKVTRRTRNALRAFRPSRFR